ncbi:lysophospholipase D GDPD1-like [Ciona intestinalis]
MSLSAGATAGYAVLGVFGGYVITSVLLLKCPTILHKKKKRDFWCSHISHRGGAAEKTENTLSAFHNAIDIGTQMLELDVHLTKDKRVVVAHDIDLKRIAGVDAKISDFDFEELPPICKCLKVTFCKDTMYNNDGEDERIPLLDQVFEEFPSIPINVDVKAENDELIMKVHDLVKKYQREKLTVWGNFSDKNCRKLHKLNPSVPLLFSMKRVLLVYVWFYTGLLPFIPLKESFFEIAYPDSFTKLDFPFSPTQKRMFSFLAFIMRSRILISHLKARGIPTYFWVVNSEEDFEGAFKLGAEGVMTDYPSKLRAWLDKNPQHQI